MIAVAEVKLLGFCAQYTKLDVSVIYDDRWDVGGDARVFVFDGRLEGNL